MPNVITTRFLYKSTDIIVVQAINISDGTAEAGAIKIDKSALPGLIDGLDVEPVAIDLLTASWRVGGYNRVLVDWNHTTNDNALVLRGNGFDDFSEVAFPRRGVQKNAHLADPGASGGTGDITFTPEGDIDGNFYDVILTCFLRK